MPKVMAKVSITLLVLGFVSGIVATSVILLLPSFSNCTSITFGRTYGGADDDIGTSVHPTYDAGYVMTGATASFGAGWLDVWLVKTNERGDTLWTRTFGGPQIDHWLVGRADSRQRLFGGQRCGLC